ncbi:MAG: asparaginase [Pseudomonadota bacterium]
MIAAIEIWRGAEVESTHDVAVCVMNDSGKNVFEWGDVSLKTFPRSAIKIIQAMPLVMSGAADAYGLDERMLALTCASHSGEPEHAALAADMLAKAGLSVADLECGAHMPSHKGAAYDLAIAHEKPSALHNNCSGKHAGMLLYAKHMGYPTKNYVQPDHPVQRDIRALLEKVLSETVSTIAIDGCSIPAYTFSLIAMARGFAQLGTGQGLPENELAAAARLRAACAAYPFYVAGTGRFDTKVMQMFGDRVFVKTGAEGVYCGIFPEKKLGFVLKALDGATRAAECMTANLIASFLELSENEKEFLAPLCAPVLTNWRGTEVGKIKPADKFLAALHQ